MSTAPARTDSVQPYSPDRPIVLVGMMGAGKTTVGRRLAKRLGVPFVDADEEIENAAGMSIADYFDQYGEAAFRDGERKVIQRLIAEQGPCVLATGGGAFMDEETRAEIQAHGVSVWLRADLELLVKRTSKRNTRPLLKQGDPREILQSLMDERYPTYAHAHVTVDTADVPHEQVVGEIVNRLADLADGR